MALAAIADGTVVVHHMGQILVPEVAQGGEHRVGRCLAQAAQGVLDPSVLFLIMGFRLPGFLQLILPLGLFLGILLSYGRLYLESEMTVLSATGMSRQRLLAITMAPAALVALIVAWLSLSLAPQGNNEFQLLLNKQDALTEFDTLEAMGLTNLDEMEETLKRYGIECDFERTGEIVVAVEPHQDADLQGEGYLTQEQMRAEVNSPTFLSGNWDRHGTAMLNPAKLVVGLARVASELGVRIHEESSVETLRKLSAETSRLVTPGGRVDAARVILATNVFPSLLKRYRLHTLPVYDYALMTEPLNAEQLAAIGWQNRQGLADPANQFHYYRPTRDGRILFGGYDAVYHYGRRVDPRYENRPEAWRRLASHFFTTFPQLEGLRFSHQWAGAIDTSTQFTAFFGTARDNRIAYTAGFTGLGVGSTRFAGNVRCTVTAFPCCCGCASCSAGLRSSQCSVRLMVSRQLTVGVRLEYSARSDIGR